MDGAQTFVALYEVGPAMNAQFIRFLGQDARPPINLADLESARLRGW